MDLHSGSELAVTWIQEDMLGSVVAAECEVYATHQSYVLIDHHLSQGDQDGPTG